MTRRTKDDFNHERQALDAAHAQNESSRDTFVALAHTALFAASISFVGSVAPIAHAVWKPALVSCWFSDVAGLLALTCSFVAARRAIDARRAALNDLEAPLDEWVERLNAIALWSFPVSLLCLFSFVTANVVFADDRQAQPPPVVTSDLHHGRSDTPCKVSNLFDKRGNPASARTNL